MTNNFDGWMHIASAPKDKEIIVWNGRRRYIVEWSDLLEGWMCMGLHMICGAEKWRGCPLQPIESLPDDEE